MTQPAHDPLTGSCSDHDRGSDRNESPYRLGFVSSALAYHDAIAKDAAAAEAYQRVLGEASPEACAAYDALLAQPEHAAVALARETWREGVQAAAALPARTRRRDLADAIWVVDTLADQLDRLALEVREIERGGGSLARLTTLGEALTCQSRRRGVAVELGAGVRLVARAAWMLGQGQEPLTSDRLLALIDRADRARHVVLEQLGALKYTYQSERELAAEAGGAS